MKKILLALFLCLLLTPFTRVTAFTGSEVNITKDGNATVSGVKVMQIFGSTLATRLYWGDAYIRLTVKTNNKTSFLRGTGEVTTIKEIAEGDLLDLTGVLEPGSSALSLLASSVKNSSVQKKQTTFSGSVVSVDLSGRKFVLDSKKFGVINVVTNEATQFTKGNRTLDLEHVRVGDIITKTEGDYDFSNKTLIAQSVLTYVDLNYYKPKNFEGQLQEITGTTAPTSIKILINGTSFVINITNKTSVFSKNRKTTLLSRFVSGDTVRVYGAIREVDEPIIDATIVRNINL